MKTLFFLFVFSTLLFSQNPTTSFKASGGVVDVVYQDNLLYCATKESVVDIFDMKDIKRIRTIHVDKIKDFMGEMVNAKVYSVDILTNQILILSQAEQGYRKIQIETDKVLENIIMSQDKLSIAKAKFLDKNTLLYATLSSEIVSFDIKQKKKNWEVKVSGAKFSDFALSEDRHNVVIADESGALKLLNTKDGKLLKTLEGQNLDNVFQVAYKNNIIATAGQDRRVVVYDLDRDSAYYKKAPFLIYSVGLSPTASLVAYSSDEEYNVQVFKTSTKENVALLTGNHWGISKILFLNESKILVSSDNEIINLYQIK